MKTLPTRCPAKGLCLPATYIRCRDADTIEVSLLSGGLVWAIRLIGIDAPEQHTDAGKAATLYAESILEKANGLLAVYIPEPADMAKPLKSLTFDRVPGHVFIGPTSTLQLLLVRAGHAKYAEGWSGDET